jgi:hypothetical protein
MTKIIKISLMATAALLTISTFAHADALADLKAAIVGIDTREAIGLLS